MESGGGTADGVTTEGRRKVDVGDPGTTLWVMMGRLSATVVLGREGVAPRTEVAVGGVACRAGGYPPNWVPMNFELPNIYSTCKR